MFKNRRFLVLSLVAASLSLLAGWGCGNITVGSPVDSCPEDFVANDDSDLQGPPGMECVLVVHDSQCKAHFLAITCDTESAIEDSPPQGQNATIQALKKQAGINAVVAKPRIRPAAAQSPTNFLLPFLQQLLPLDPGLASTAPATGPFFTCDPNLNFYAVEHENSTVAHEFPCGSLPNPRIHVVSRPLQAAVTPDSTELWVTSYDNAITIVNTSTDQVLSTIFTDQNTFPSGIAVSPDGTKVYVTSFIDYAPALITYNRAARTEITRVSLPTEYPQSVFLTPDGSTAIVTHPLDSVMDLVDTLSNTVIASIPISQPYGVGFSPNGTTAYITSWPKSVVVLDLITLKQTGTYTVGLNPIGAKISTNGRWITTDNYGDGTVSEIDTVSGNVNSIQIGGTPHGITSVD